jgi:hypothetical protein
VIPEAIKKMLGIRQSYKRVFTGRDGDRVMEDLIKKYILASPVKGDADITLINLGKQQLALEIVQKVYGSDEEFRRALERSTQTTNQQDIE